MAQKKIGVVIPGNDAASALADIQRAEELGIPAAWMITAAAGLDALTLFASAAVRTQRIMLGTSITPTFPRHPLVAAQQVQVVAQLAPGRFRLGVGPSHRPIMEKVFGIDFKAPLGHLSEYLTILKALLQEGSVDFEGRYYRARARIPTPIDVPVMASAVQARALELCGAQADGVITWVCPGSYLRDVAIPAVKKGAEQAGRPVPPLIAHAPVCVHENAEEVREAIRQQFSAPRMPFYQRMFVAAGFPEATQGAWSDAMIDAAVLSGDESRVAAGLDKLFSYGASEVYASPIPAGDDQAGSLERTLQLLARVSGD